MRSVGVTRERLAKRLDRAGPTLRRWEANGLIPRPVQDGVIARYEPQALKVWAGADLSDVDYVVVQGNSIFIVRRDETVVWRKANWTTEMPEKRSSQRGQYPVRGTPSKGPESRLIASEGIPHGGLDG